MFALNATQNFGTDSQPDFLAQSLGMFWRNSPTIFGAVSPSYKIPGTTVGSPEFGLFNNLSLTQRSEALWGIISTNMGGYTDNHLPQSRLMTNFTRVPARVDALNHLAYHGQTPATEQSAIISYASQIRMDGYRTPLLATMFLALYADEYTVAQ